MIGCSRVSAPLGELVIMNLEYSSIGFNLNQWKILLGQQNITNILLDNVDEQEIISWLNCQKEWQSVAHSRYLTLFQRKKIDLVIPAA